LVAGMLKESSSIVVRSLPLFINEKLFQDLFEKRAGFKGSRLAYDEQNKYALIFLLFLIIY
jgi:hypothetical protein